MRIQESQRSIKLLSMSVNNSNYRISDTCEGSIYQNGYTFKYIELSFMVNTYLIKPFISTADQPNPLLKMQITVVIF